MTETKDVLFLRLCVRQEIFSQEDAKKLLAYYRENANRREDIADFLVREEYLDAETGASLNRAINRRAEGHVSTRKPVPSRAVSGGGAARTRRAQPQSVRMDPLQLTLTGIGALVLIGAVIFLAVYMNREKKTASEVIQEKQDQSEQRREKAAQKKEPTTVLAAEPKSAVYTEAQKEQFEDRTNLALTNAKRDLADLGPLRAIKTLNVAIERFEGEAIPAEHINRLKEEITAMEKHRSERFERYKRQLEKARSENQSEKIRDLEEKIKLELGPDYLDKVSG